MYEPKYKLNKRDRARWQLLVTRDACELGKPSKKFPPLTLAERVELERLTQEQRRRLYRHPKMKAYLRRHRRLMARSEKLMARFKRQIRRLENSRK